MIDSLNRDAEQSLQADSAIVTVYALGGSQCARHTAQTAPMTRYGLSVC